MNQHYRSPNGNDVLTNTSLDSLFTDDFGGAAVNPALWDVFDGGLGANVDLGQGVLTQAAIGSGTTGITDSVAASALTVAMGTTNGAERWYLSKEIFAGKEDILVLLSRSQANANNHIFIGLVEVDPKTFVPLLNANLAAEFTNSGGCQFGLTATTTAFQARALGDSSSALAVGAIGVAGAALSTTQEFLIEIDSRDIHVSSATIDTVAAKAAGASRVSSQCPNDTKLYKLLMRFKNVGVPTATSVVVQRILVVDNYEQRVQISSGEGDLIGSKAVPVSVTNSPSATLLAGTATIGAVFGNGSAANNGLTDHKLIAAATTNATSVKASAGRIHQGWVYNTTASAKFLKLYNKASAPTVGTDTPVMTLPIPANNGLDLASIFGIYGKYFATGVAYALTGAAADADTTALAAGDVIVNMGWI